MRSLSVNIIVMRNEARSKLEEAIRNYLDINWHINAGDDELERYLAGIMAFIAVEVWGKPFMPFSPPTICTEEEDEK